MTLDWFGHHHGRHESLVHRLPAAWKLTVALLLIAGTVTIPFQYAPWFVGVSLVLILTWAGSRLPLFFLLKRLAMLSPLVLGVAVANAFHPARRADWVEVAARSFLCLATVLLLSNTTPFSDMLRVLRRVRVPALLITTLMLMHRYLFVMAEEAERMRRARASRTFTRQRQVQWFALSTVVGQLFVRASERAERIYDAMCARGWR